MNKIKLGYEIPGCEAVYIHPSHLIVTGITQQSGKTTTLEALVLRSGAKAIVFKTKIGEKSFSTGTVVAPFFRDRSDYEFVRSLIEAYSKEKLFIEKGTLMTLCKGSKNLIEIKRRVDDEIATGKLRGIKQEIYTRLQHYLEELIPQIQYAKFSSTLSLIDGINIMDLERFSPEAQSLIIRSVADEVLTNGRDTIIIMPEAWKFIPQKRNNPCKQAVESFIRQGAANGNYIWIDSQDMSGVDKTPLKQISTWILGYQSERNEVEHTLDQISLPAKSKPKSEDIMNLAIGHFFLSSRDQVVKVYVQPAWLSDQDARHIAGGIKDTSEAMASKPLPSLIIDTAPARQSPSDNNGYATKKEVLQIRIDFFNKIDQLVTNVNNFTQNFSNQTPELDYDQIAGIVLQKMPVQSPVAVTTPIPSAKAIELVTAEVLKRIPKSSGQVVYEVAPLEKIKKDFLIEARDKIIADARSLSERQMKIVKFVEAQNKGCNQSFIIEKCFFMLATSGGTRAWVSKDCSEITSLQLLKKDKNGIIYPHLIGRIRELMGTHQASADEIQITYNHILMEIIK